MPNPRARTNNRFVVEERKRERERERTFYFRRYIHKDYFLESVAVARK